MWNGLGFDHLSANIATIPFNHWIKRGAPLEKISSQRQEHQIAKKSNSSHPGKKKKALRGGARLTLKTFADLLANEKEIVAKIAALLNGGNLFLANPFLCLADVGVQLSPKLKEELISRDPSLGTLSTEPYTAIKKELTAQPTQVRVHGLFKRE